MDIPETRFARTPEGHVAYQVLGDGPLDIAFVGEATRTSTSCGSTRRSEGSFGDSLRSGG